MSQQLRYVIFIVVSLVIVIVWGAYFAPKPVPEGNQPVATESQKATAPSPAPVAKAAPTPNEAPKATPAPTPAPAAAEPALETATIDTPKWTAVFSTKGGALLRYDLKGQKQMQHEGDPTKGVNLAHSGDDQPLPLSTAIGDALPESTGYRLVSKAPGQIVFERAKGGLDVTKTFRWPADGYTMALDVAVRRTDGTAGKVPVTVVYTASEAHPTTGGLLSFATRAEIHEAACYLDDNSSMDTRGYGKAEAAKSFTENPRFAAIDEKYFLAAIAPASKAENPSCTLASKSANDLAASYKVDVAVPAGGAGEAKFDLFLGPKATDLLRGFGHGSEVSVYNGSIAKAGKLLLPILKVFNDVAHNWGVAIILLTVLVKLVTLPLSHKQMKSMDQMKVIAPKMEALKKKHEGDPQRLNAETMKLYKEHGINPIGCAVPMLIQMPIWWALYDVLGSSYDLYNEPFIHGWINDLTIRDPFFVLPVLMTVTMLISQILSPQTAPQQGQMKAMTYGMPVFFGLLMMGLPSGLVLYIFTNNLLSIGQSLWFRRAYPRPPTAAPAL